MQKQSCIQGCPQGSFLEARDRGRAGRRRGWGSEGGDLGVVSSALCWGSRLWPHVSESGPFNQGCGHRGGLRLKAAPTGDWTPPQEPGPLRSSTKPPFRQMHWGRAHPFTRSLGRHLLGPHGAPWSAGPRSGPRPWGGSPAQGMMEIQTPTASSDTIQASLPESPA